jgi:cytochrome b involved in lipid metabolism
MSKKVVGIIIAVILVGGVLGWFFMQRETAAPDVVENQKQGVMDKTVVPPTVNPATPESVPDVQPKKTTPPPVANPAPKPTLEKPVVVPPPSGPKTYTMTEVAMHKDSKSCWSAISGTVYDLTAWITKHPGGAANILSICGKDGTSAFTGQHEGEPKPANILAGYEIGILK